MSGRHYANYLGLNGGERHDDDGRVGKSWLEDWKTDVLYLIRSSRELVIEKEEEGE